MARKSEQTLEFWQFDTGLFDDGKIIDLNEKYGPVGEAIYFRILSYIAQSNGYYACFDSALVLYVYRSIGNKWLKSRQYIEEVIFYCGECGLFDVSLLQRKIISSRGIQRRWLYAKKKSRARGYSTTEFWLLNEEKSNQPEHGVLYDFENSCINNSDNCNSNSDNCNNNSLCISQVNTIPPISPKGGAAEDDKQKFFAAYPKLKGAKINDSGIDYDVLLDRFSSSKHLRNTYSMKWVCEHYEEIKSGVFADAESEADKRAERERWYACRKEQAESTARKFVEKAMSIPTFAQAERRLRILTIESAKAEVKGDAETLAAIEKDKKALWVARSEGLRIAGVLEEDLLPNYHCKKCSDTGFLPDGRACDCYRK